MMQDHAKGCEGRNYTCTCGYDTALSKRCAELEAALKPFVYNSVSVQESTKLIQKSCGDMVPVSLSVTKAQFLALRSLIQEQTETKQ